MLSLKTKFMIASVAAIAITIYSAFANYAMMSK